MAIFARGHSSNPREFFALLKMLAAAVVTVLAMSGHAFAVDVNAGPIWNNDDANNKCPHVCSGLQWNGQWSTTQQGVMSVCGTTAGVDIPIGPISNNDDAKGKCPGQLSKTTWSGQWRTTQPGTMSVCGCNPPPVVTAAAVGAAAPEGQIDWGAPPLSPTEMNEVMAWIAAQTAAINLPFCWRQSYGNGAGEPYVCAAGLERNGLLCYPKCKAGFDGAGPVCWESCPAGYKDTGADCLKPASYGRGAGYVIWDGDKCNRENPQGCEKNGALWYPKCQANFHAVGCCVCSPDCPSGMTDVGVSCAKNSYGRGAGQPLDMGVCAPGLQKDPSGALCYPACKAEFHMVGPVCWQNCPAQQPTDCAAGCSTDSKTCASAVVNQTISPIMMAVSLIPIAGEISDAAKAAKGAATAAEEAAEVSKLAQIAAKLKELYAPVQDLMKAAKGNLAEVVGGEENLAKIFAVGKVTAKVGSATYTVGSAANRQIDLYSREVADNFTDMTSVAINAQIDKTFGKTAAYQIKRQWGVRSVLLNMENDNFATAKNAVSAASAADPTGILSTVSAYMQPLCKNTVPFPTVHPLYNN